MNGLRNLAAYAYFSPNDLPKPIFFSFAALVIGSLPKEAGGGARGELKGSEYFLEALLGRVLVIRRKGIKVLSCALFSSFSSCCVITGIALLCPQFGQIVASSGVRVLTVLNLLRSIFKMLSDLGNVGGALASARSVATFCSASVILSNTLVTAFCAAVVISDSAWHLPKLALSCR